MQKSTDGKEEEQRIFGDFCKGDFEDKFEHIKGKGLAHLECPCLILK